MLSPILTGLSADVESFATGPAEAGRYGKM